MSCNNFMSVDQSFFLSSDRHSYPFVGGREVVALNLFEKIRELQNEIKENNEQLDIISLKNNFSARSSAFKEFFERYEIIKIVGIGSCSTVCKISDISSKKLYAAKFSDLPDLNNVNHSIFQHEHQIFSRYLNGVPNVVELVDKIDSNNAALFVFEYLGDMNIFKKYLESKVGISLFHLTIFAKQILEALEALKSKGVVHADLKPDNLFYDEEKEELKVIDFGISFISGHPKFTNEVQTLFYRAPEAILYLPNLDTEIDMWSLGIILFEIYTGESMFVDLSEVKDNKEGHKKIFSRIAAFLGIPPESFVKDSRYRSWFYGEQGYKKTLTPSFEKKFGRKYIENKLLKRAEKNGDDIKSVNLLRDLILGMLKYKNRVTPKEALNYQIFTRTEKSVEGLPLKKRRIS